MTRSGQTIYALVALTCAISLAIIDPALSYFNPPDNIARAIIKLSRIFLIIIIGWMVRLVIREVRAMNEKRQTTKERTFPEDADANQ
jgi:Na+-driven multidrug efflux pump